MLMLFGVAGEEAHPSMLLALSSPSSFLLRFDNILLLAVLSRVYGYVLRSPLRALHAQGGTG